MVQVREKMIVAAYTASKSIMQITFLKEKYSSDSAEIYRQHS